MKIKDLKQFQGFIFLDDVESFKNEDLYKFPTGEISIYVKLNNTRFCGVGKQIGNTFLNIDFSNTEVLPVGY